MYYSIEGNVKHVTPAQVVLETGGVGYEINISLYTYTAIQNKSRALLYTHLVVREDAHTLYGFYTVEEKEIFLLLIGVSGVGPNTARMINSSLSTSELKSSVLSENVAAIQSVKGIGAKTAQRIIIDLKDKILKLDGELSQISVEQNNTLQNEALSALIALGFDSKSAQKVIKKTMEKNKDIQGLEQLIKLALQNI